MKVNLTAEGVKQFPDATEPSGFSSPPVKDRMDQPPPTKKEREIILHALGLTPTGWGRMKRWAYRNYFAATPTEKDGEYQALVAMSKRGWVNGRGSGKDPMFPYIRFEVTVLGIKAMGDDIMRRVPREFRKVTAK